MSEEDLEIKEGLVIPGWELWVTASRSGGPGGQHANKASTQVSLHWSVRDTSILEPEVKKKVERRLATYTSEEGVVQITVSDTRSQHRNRQIARKRLAAKIAKALQRRKRRIATRPTYSSQKRRVEEKRERGKLKEQRRSPGRDDW